MKNSKRIGELLGPTLMVMVASEFPLIQPHLYDEQIPPVVYLSGVLMFVAGLAIVRSHNLWQRNWTLLITICGWFLLALGLFRMFAASFYQQTTGNTSSLFFIIVECILFAIGSLITWKSYARAAKS
ncbi:hypothetical protein [Phormidium tenue]|uniref:Uncharacterized protein n=1 Tax=Phormidium tenue FACHB-1050 TaxID=2692857 RepID=A0ABR8CBA2_9CYAN|nr:hypothetical protein [Phormidium tenue]MBD2317665.1 hypothetical protein [Phormidium tenue FACHB-1050]